MATRGPTRSEAMPMVGMVPDRKDNFYDKLHGRMVLPSSIIEFYPDATLVVDDQGKVIAWNKAMEKLTGVVAGDMLGKGDYEYAIPFYGERKPMLLDMVGLPEEKVNERYTDLVFEDGKLEAMTIKARLKGKDAILWGTAGRLYGLDGKVKGAIESIRDVTSKKMMEKALMEAHDELERRVAERTAELAEARGTLQTVLDTVPAGIVKADAEGRITYTNQSAAKLFCPAVPALDLRSTDRPYLLIRPDGNLIKPEERPLSRSVFMGEHVRDEEVLVRHPDGRDISVLISSAPMVDGGRIVGAVASAVDITERKLIENALRESEEKFRVLTETTSSAIFIYQGGHFRYVNRASENVTGYSSEELLSMNFWDWVHPDFQDAVKSYGHARRNGSLAPARYEIKFVTKAGEVRWAELIPGLIIYKKKPAILVTAVDITERKKVEEALKEAKQQAELYVDLMGHDINNMNQVAIGYLEMAMGTMPQGDPTSVYMGRSFAMLQDSSRLIDNLRKVQQAVGKKLKLEVIDLGAMLTEVRSEHSMVPGREVAIDYTPGEYPVRANQLLKDVFSNIVGNAIKHSIGAVTIAIEVRTLSLNGRRYYEVWVEDDGPGIPDDLKDAIFSRAKRGSTNARGNGLGLYLARSLVEGFNGRVWAEDRVRGEHCKGSRFVVRLPAAD